MLFCYSNSLKNQIKQLADHIFHRQEISIMQVYYYEKNCFIFSHISIKGILILTKKTEKIFTENRNFI